MNNYPNMLETYIPYVYNDVYLADIFETIWYNLGNICSNYGMSKLAIFCFENALRHKRKSIRNIYRIGREFVFLRDFEKVSDVMKNLSDFELSSFHFNVLKGHLYLSKNSLSKSHYHFSKASEYGKEDLLLLLGIAKWNELSKKNTAAFEYFSLLLKKYPAHIISFETHFRIVSLCKFDGSIKYAIRLLKALEEDNGNVHREAISIQLASCYELLNEDEFAIKICKDILDCRSTYIFAHRLLGYILLKNRKYYEVVKILRRNTDAYVSYVLGKAFTALNMMDEAYECFSFCLNNDKHNSMFWNSFGVMYYNTNQVQDACYCFRNAILCNENTLEPLFNMALTKIKKGKNLNKILESLESLVLKDPYDKETSDLYDLVKKFLKKHPENLENYKILQDSIVGSFKCKEKDINLAFTPYFATHLFFGGKIFNNKEEEDKRF